MNPRLKKGLIVAVLHLAIVGSLGVKLLDRPGHATARVGADRSDRSRRSAQGPLRPASSRG